MALFDFIFVASALVSDPSESSSDRHIRYILTILDIMIGLFFPIPPADPSFIDTNPVSWHLINRTHFDISQFVDCFQSTHLHLTLTDLAVTSCDIPLIQGTKIEF